MPATPVPAATVILLRDGAISPEVLMLERHSDSAFLPDMYVFPGGRVEPQDQDLADRLTGVGVDEARAALPGVDPELAAGFFVAAIRETFEESGILLARGRGQRDLIDAARAGELARHRLAVQDGSTAFRELVEAEALDLAADMLTVHAHWITPEAVPRRFDTIFFSAIAPPHQRAAHDGVESTSHVWTRPEDALERAKKDELRLIFPTARNLETLVGFADAAAALRASRERTVVTVLPVVQERDGRRELTIPGDAGYDVTSEAMS